MTVPRLVYDDDCGFCKYFVHAALDRGEFEAVGFAELDDALRARLPDDYEECMHLVTDEAVYSCGAALEQVTKRTGAAGWWLTVVARALPRYPKVRERAYRWVADRRSVLGTYVSKRSVSE